jgi:hypothetical protein
MRALSIADCRLQIADLGKRIDRTVHPSRFAVRRSKFDVRNSKLQIVGSALTYSLIFALLRSATTARAYRSG